MTRYNGFSSHLSIYPCDSFMINIVYIMFIAIKSAADILPISLIRTKSLNSFHRSTLWFDRIEIQFL